MKLISSCLQTKHSEVFRIYRNYDSGVHPTFHLMGTGGIFPGGKAAWGVKVTTHLQLVQKSRKCGFIHALSH
jgi:hypothetical protein